MPNKKYQGGVRLERKIVNAFRAGGWNALRSAGSHSPMDVVAWRGAHTGDTKCIVNIMNALGFHRVNDTYVRHGNKHDEILYYTSFDLRHPNDEYIIMFQCKRVKHG